jgi:hypothetical protein
MVPSESRARSFERSMGVKLPSVDDFEVFKLIVGCAS